MRTRTTPPVYTSDIFLGQEFTLASDGKTYLPSYTRYMSKYLRGGYKFCEDELHKGPPYKTGGPFDLISTIDGGHRPIRIGTYVSKSVHPVTLLPTRIYNGGFACSYGPRVFVANQFFGKATKAQKDAFFNVSPYGAIGWNRFKPTKPVMDIATALVELRDLPHMLKQTAKGFNDIWRSMGGSRTSFGPKKVANQWLNYQFGWRPFINDCQNFIKGCNTFDKWYNQKLKDNNKWVLRSGTVANDVDTSLKSSASVTAHTPAPNDMFNYVDGSIGKHRVYEDTYTKVWFKARFKYYLRNIDRFSMARNYFGLNFSPSVVYELTPWSWLIDWFSNAGDCISNMTDYNDLTAKYAYVMGSRESRFRIESEMYYHKTTLRDTFVHSLSRKQRVEANPFGFGLTWDALSARQLSILGALGIGRLPISA